MGERERDPKEIAMKGSVTIISSLMVLVLLEGIINKSCCSIGAKKVKIECTQFREYCNAGNAEG